MLSANILIQGAGKAKYEQPPTSNHFSDTNQIRPRPDANAPMSEFKSWSQQQRTLANQNQNISLPNANVPQQNQNTSLTAEHASLAAEPECISPTAEHTSFAAEPEYTPVTAEPLSTSRAIGLLNLWQMQTGSWQGSLSLDGVALSQHIGDFARPSRMALGNEMCPCSTRTVSLLFFFALQSFIT